LQSIALDSPTTFHAETQHGEPWYRRTDTDTSYPCSGSMAQGKVQPHRLGSRIKDPNGRGARHILHVRRWTGRPCPGEIADEEDEFVIGYFREAKPQADNSNERAKAPYKQKSACRAEGRLSVPAQMCSRTRSASRPPGTTDRGLSTTAGRWFSRMANMSACASKGARS